MTLAKRDVPAIVRGKAHFSQHLSRRLPYYLTPNEVHALIETIELERDRLLVQTLWQTGVRGSEAIRLKLEDVGRRGIRVLGKGSVRARHLRAGRLSQRDLVPCSGGWPRS